ncbi:uncharacterized protein LOC143554199 [Bidens hawaiensis]|uniref:uncharacterized protein LOC143554199 n=1 Tax=Bidens hawaiensis TaxID=980011 RepID=UPI004049098D
MASESPPNNNNNNINSQFLFINRRCCFCIPYLTHKPPSSSPDHHSHKSLCSRGIQTLKKIREWSEIVAGPRWKTFIRRFNRNKSSTLNRQNSKFQYDPLGYALNFDEGALESGDSEMENDYLVRTFSSRYAVPIGPKTTSDHGKDAIGLNSV